MCTPRQLLPAIALVLLSLPIFAQNPEEGLQEVYSINVFFDFGKYDIRTSEYNELTELAMKSLKLKKYRIDVTAHTDNVGTNERNYILSDNRAEAVRSYLIREGVPRVRIFTGIMGEYEPTSNNETESGRQQNRRATVTLYEIVPITEIKETVYLTDTVEKIKEVLVEQEPEVIVLEEPEVEVVKEPEVIVLEEPEVEIVEEPEVIVLEEPEVEVMEEHLDGPLEEPEEELPLDDPEEQVEVGQTIELKNIYFEGDSDQLLIASEPQLRNLLQFLEVNPDIKIEIGGHINYQDVLLKQDSPDFQLSVNRAKAVYDYLLSNGVGPERMAYKGYGNWQMSFPNPESEFDAAQNRRVEIKILEN